MIYSIYLYLILIFIICVYLFIGLNLKIDSVNNYIENIKKNKNKKINLLNDEMLYFQKSRNQ
jgi:hypothetical protein